jgi:hypothetical protein
VRSETVDLSRKLDQAVVEAKASEESNMNASEYTVSAIAPRNHGQHHFHTDSTFEAHYSIGDLAKQWRLGRETVRLLLKDEPGVVKVRMGLRKVITRYSVPESVARRVHTRLFHPAA